MVYPLLLGWVVCMSISHHLTSPDFATDENYDQSHRLLIKAVCLHLTISMPWSNARIRGVSRCFNLQHDHQTSTEREPCTYNDVELLVLARGNVLLAQYLLYRLTNQVAKDSPIKEDTIKTFCPSGRSSKSIESWSKFRVSAPLD